MVEKLFNRKQAGYSCGVDRLPFWAGWCCVCSVFFELVCVHLLHGIELLALWKSIVEKDSNPCDFPVFRFLSP